MNKENDRRLTERRIPNVVAQYAVQELARVRAALLASKLSHYTCDDCWYSCPKSGNCCDDDAGEACNCGADEHNAAIDAAMQSAPRTDAPKEGKL